MNSELLILGLHRVGLPPLQASIRGLFTSPQLLAFQISLLRRAGYVFSTLGEALANPQRKTAVITFDDGYADNFSHALPVLRRFQIPATVFVITGDVGQSHVVWDEAGEKLPSAMLDWNALAELRRNGWEIGSHAHRHVHLARRTEAEQEALIKRSLIEIEKNLGFAPVSFAYPYGSYNAATKKILRRAGIKYAVTTNPTRRADCLAPGDLLELTRCAIGGRQIHHYVKSTVRTAKATGIVEPVKTAARQFLTSALNRQKPEKAALLSLQAAHHEIVPRQ